MRTDDTIVARKAYRRNDDGIVPDEVIDDVSTEQLKKQLMHITIQKQLSTKIGLERQNKTQGNRLKVMNGWFKED